MTNFILGSEFDKLHEVPLGYQKPNQTLPCTANIAASTGITAAPPVFIVLEIFQNNFTNYYSDINLDSFPTI